MKSILVDLSSLKNVELILRLTESEAKDFAEFLIEGGEWSSSCGGLVAKAVYDALGLNGLTD